MFIKDKEVYKYALKENNNNHVDALPGGRYEVTIINGMFGSSLLIETKKQKDLLIKFKGEPFDSINALVRETFSDHVMQVHKDIGYMNKCGILLYGPPGTGKTSAIDLITEEVGKEYGVVTLYFNEFDGNTNIESIIDAIRENDADRPIIIVLEEFDNIVSGYNNFTGSLLNFLDGPNSRNNVVTIATTNFINKISDQFTKRASRFKLLQEISSAPYEIILSILKEKVPEKYKSSLNIDKIAYKMTEGKCTVDQVKSVIINILAYKMNTNKAIKLVTNSSGNTVDLDDYDENK